MNYQIHSKIVSEMFFDKKMISGYSSQITRGIFQRPVPSLFREMEFILQGKRKIIEIQSK